MRRCWVAYLLFATLHATAQQAGFSMAAQATLDREFAAKSISYLLLDGQGAVLAQRWPEGIQTPISPGSLVKPWLAIAYGEEHGGEFPNVVCRGKQSRCWYPPGHGKLGLQKALAVSCNAYFLQLAAGLNRERARQILARYDLRRPDSNAPDGALVGLEDEWKESPLQLSRAYLMLAKERGQPLQSKILLGMAESASSGTSRALGDTLGHDMVFAKTGTAACTHTPRATGDGFALAIYPAGQPRFLLLVRVHGITGASSANVAAAMLRALGAGALR